MLVYRIGRTKFADDITGEGARLHGGRWNHKLVPCIYTSESRALALLEYTANVNIDDIPRALSVSIFEIAESLVLELPAHLLPGDWRFSPTPSSTKEFGSSLLSSGRHLIIKIPSVIIMEEYNYLVNPKYADRSHFKLLEIKDLIYDVRLKLK